jgi:hypothetical protein
VTKVSDITTTSDGASEICKISAQLKFPFSRMKKKEQGRKLGHRFLKATRTAPWTSALFVPVFVGVGEGNRINGMAAVKC